MDRRVLDRPPCGRSTKILSAMCLGTNAEHGGKCLLLYPWSNVCDFSVFPVWCVVVDTDGCWMLCLTVDIAYSYNTMRPKLVSSYCCTAVS